MREGTEMHRKQSEFTFMFKVSRKFKTMNVFIRIILDYKIQLFQGKVNVMYSEIPCKLQHTLLCIIKFYRAYIIQ